MTKKPPADDAEVIQVQASPDAAAAFAMVLQAAAVLLEAGEPTDEALAALPDDIRAGLLASVTKRRKGVSEIRRALAELMGRELTNEELATLVRTTIRPAEEKKPKKRGRPRRLPATVPQQTWPEFEAVVFGVVRDGKTAGAKGTLWIETPGEVALSHKRPGSDLSLKLGASTIDDPLKDYAPLVATSYDDLRDILATHAGQRTAYLWREVWQRLMARPPRAIRPRGDAREGVSRRQEEGGAGHFPPVSPARRRAEARIRRAGERGRAPLSRPAFGRVGEEQHHCVDRPPALEPT